MLRNSHVGILENTLALSVLIENIVLKKIILFMTIQQPPTKIGNLLAALPTLPAHDPTRLPTGDGLRGGHRKNRDRADLAAQLLATFQQALQMEEDIPTATAGLICDLLHLLHANNCDLLPALQTALHKFLYEAAPVSSSSSHLPAITKSYIVHGRIPGDDDDTFARLHLSPEECPIEAFIERILYGGNIPRDWQSRSPTSLENRFGEWAYIHGVIQLD